MAADRLFALWWLIALRGLRRGEAAGLRWADVDLDRRVIMNAQQHIAYGHTVAIGPPYTNVLLDLHFKSAEATARLVLAAAARNPAKRHRHRIPAKSAAPPPATGPQPQRPKRSRRARARQE